MPADAYVHKKIAGAAGAPLLFLLHGTGGDESQLLTFGRELLPGSTLIAPRGDVSEAGATRFFRRTGEGVYDLDDLGRATAKMAAFVRAHSRAAPRSSLLGLGYSNGANILASVVFAEPGLFDAVVLMHPLIPFAPKIAGKLAGSVLITAGRHDPICPPAVTSRLEAYLRDAGADVSLVWHEGGHEIRPAEIEAARRFLSTAVRRGEAGMSEAPEAWPDVRLEEHGSKGRYLFGGSGGAVAEMTFSKAGQHLIIIDHTDVPEGFRGQGVGLRLVARAVEDARATGRKIIPLCPFAKAQFGKHPEWADVLGGKAR